MHSYLRAIGFSKLEQKDLDQILQEVIVSCDEKKIAEQGNHEALIAQKGSYAKLWNTQQELEDYRKEKAS